MTGIPGRPGNGNAGMQTLIHNHCDLFYIETRYEFNKVDHYNCAVLWPAYTINFQSKARLRIL